MLGKLVEFLEEQDPSTVVRYGFGEPMSYRGYYDDCAFEPAEFTTFGAMLSHAESALNKAFVGYKGGEYLMDEDTECWIAKHGRTSNDKIGEHMLETWKLLAGEI